MELYIHLPFCVRKCRYCDFPSYSGCESLMPAYVEAVLAEARRFTAPEAFTTVYLGGGTPSLLPPPLLRRLLTGLREALPIAADAEFSAEANPGTLTAQWLETAVAGGVNRLSLGVQAAQPQLLQVLGRIHTTGAVCESVRLLCAAGIRNYNLDLMFGLPGQTQADWDESLAFALDLRPTHLSCYGLIPEEGTPLKADLDAGRLSLPDEETERAMYEAARTAARTAGLAQYEISNFALPGCECRHNLGYWQQVPYLGLGASAASMLPDTNGGSAYLRRQNPTDLPAYLRLIDSGALPESEPISRREAMFETLMLGLRVTAGIPLARFEALHGQALSSVCGETVELLIRQGLLETEDGCLRLTRRGMDVQNSVLVTLMDCF